MDTRCCILATKVKHCVTTKGLSKDQQRVKIGSNVGLYACMGGGKYHMGSNVGMCVGGGKYHMGSNVCVCVWGGSITCLCVGGEGVLSTSTSTGYTAFQTSPVPVVYNVTDSTPKEGLPDTTQGGYVSYGAQWWLISDLRITETNI